MKSSLLGRMTSFSSAVPQTNNLVKNNEFSSQQVSPSFCKRTDEKRKLRKNIKNEKNQRIANQKKIKIKMFLDQYSQLVLDVPSVAKALLR